ncbi:MAG: hypothetical protein K2K68_06525 [Duncaniella sp.]|nr:hypothetical protein [Duncaniella sp.]
MNIPMKTSEKISRFFENSFLTAKGIVKIILQSRRCGLKAEDRHGKRLIIMGNGPSLAETIHNHSNVLRQSDTMAVNFAANAPEFFDLRPKYYILADPHFFSSSDVNVKKLKENLTKVSWDMVLIIPHGADLTDFSVNPAITVARFNAIGVEGFDFFTEAVYSRSLAMPRPRNVLIPAIMSGISLGYRDIAIAGADHTWTQTLSVNENNEVVSIQPHFYKESAEEKDRIRAVYRDVRMHDILYSFHVAFRAYHLIKRFADRKGVRIVNATPGSFIDAFPRGQL